MISFEESKVADNQHNYHPVKQQRQKSPSNNGFERAQTCDDQPYNAYHQVMRPKILRPVDEVNSELEHSSTNNRQNTHGSGLNKSRSSEQNGGGGPKTGSGGSSNEYPYGGSKFVVKRSGQRERGSRGAAAAG